MPLRPSSRRVLQAVFTVFAAAAIALFGSSSSFAATAAPSVVRPLHTDVTYTSDNGVPPSASVKGTINWSSRDNYSAKWVITDIRSDGHGPWLFVTAIDYDGEVFKTPGKHCTTGYHTSCNLSTSTFSGAGIEQVQARVCNGGSASSPDDCNVGLFYPDLG